MIIPAVANQICTVLVDAFESDHLVAMETVYPSPEIKAVRAMKDFEIQVVPGPSFAMDTDGNTLRVSQQIIIGLFVRLHIDDGGKHAMALADTSNSILVKNLVVLKTLDGNFLPYGALATNLLVRPLKYFSETQVYEMTTSCPGMLIQRVNYICGLNFGLPIT